MSGNDIADLTILGTLHQHSRTYEVLAGNAKSLIPELWNPTADVLDQAISRNLEAGYINHHKGIPFSQYSLSRAGNDHFLYLMTLDAGPRNSAFARALEALQFCFLDGACPAAAATILDRHHERIIERLTELRRRCHQRPGSGAYARLWMETEQRRLELTMKMLSEARILNIGNPAMVLQEAAE